MAKNDRIAQLNWAINDRAKNKKAQFLMKSALFTVVENGLYSRRIAR
jgi:hypothetical protein